MASLKEIKARIASIQSTQKITAAMRMVASAKLRKTQTMTENFLRYKEELRGIVDCLTPRQLSSIVEERSQQADALLLIPISSNSGLCGAFNSNIAKATIKHIEELKAKGADVKVLPIGKKIAHELKKTGIEHVEDHITLMEQVERGDGYAHATELVDYIYNMSHGIQSLHVEFIYHHFKSMGSQTITISPLSPLQPVAVCASNRDCNSQENKAENIYLTEPSREELISILHPQLLCAEVYGTLLNSLTSEHAARMLAMQTADDNANDLLKELTLTYNKTRQQAITNELIDIMGGKSAS